MGNIPVIITYNYKQDSASYYDVIVPISCKIGPKIAKIPYFGCNKSERNIKFDIKRLVVTGNMNGVIKKLI